MSAIAQRILTVGRPAAISSDSLWIPLLGGLWVVSNVALGGLGIHMHRTGSCAFVAGLINGTLIAMIAVATASERFQAGTTGLLGGLSLSGLRSDGSMIWKCMQTVHDLVDKALRATGIPLDEKLHDAIEREALYMIWTMVFVVMASLIAEWVRSCRTEAGTGTE
jgi:hypothetical protein